MAELPSGLVGRIALRLSALPVPTVGVAGYLGTGRGNRAHGGGCASTGSTDSFRSSCTVPQGGGAAGCWALVAGHGDRQRHGTCDVGDAICAYNHTDVGVPPEQTPFCTGFTLRNPEWTENRNYN